jgi:opacity protein-like surface antigen
MKKYIILIVLVTCIGKASISQLRFNTYAIGAFSDKVSSYYSQQNNFSGQVNGGFIWGGGIEFTPNKNMGVELMYNRMDTKSPLVYNNNSLIVQKTNFNLGINQIMLGFNKYFPGMNPKVEPYVGGCLGLSIFDLKNPDNNASNSYTKFGYGIRTGVNIWASKRVALKLQAQLFSASQAIGGGFYFGTGGSGAGITTYSTFYQFGLGGGLTFKLGDDHAVSSAKRR